MRNRHYRLFVTAGFSALLTLTVVLPAMYKMYISQPPALASVDLNKLVQEEESRFTAKIGPNLSDEASRSIATSVEEYGKRLSVEVEALSKECNCILLNKAAFLGSSSVVDMTPQLRERLAR